MNRRQNRFGRGRGAYDAADDDEAPPRHAPTARAEANAARAARRRENLERQRQEALGAEARRQLAAAEREATQRPQDEDGDRLLNTVQLVTQCGIAAIQLPLDYAKAIDAPGEEAPRLRVLLHTDRPGTPALQNIQWAPENRSERYALATEVKMWQLGATCWVAEVPLPAAFSRPDLLAQAHLEDGSLVADDMAGAEGVLDDDEAIEAVERLKADRQAAAPWSGFNEVDCLLSRGVLLREVSRGLVNLRVGQNSLTVPEADPERATRTVHLQGFLGGSLPPFASVRLVDRNNTATVQNLPAVLNVLSGHLTFDIAPEASAALGEPDVVSARLRATPAEMLGGTVFADWPLAPPNHTFPALVASHWRRVYFELLASLSSLESRPSERLRLHAHLLAFAAHQCLGPEGVARNVQGEVIAVRSLLTFVGTAGNAAFVDGASPAAGTAVRLDTTQQFVADAFAAATTGTAASAGGDGSTGSSASHAAGSTARSAQRSQCDEAVWLLGLAGQLFHALRNPLHPNGTRADEAERRDLEVEMRPPDALWTKLSPTLWSGEGFRALSASLDELRNYGWRAVKAGLTATLAPDAQWLFAHPEAEELARGVSSYRFARLLPLRATLDDGGGSVRQYALQIAPDTEARWLRRIGLLRERELRDAHVLENWEAARAEADAGGKALAAKQRLAQAILTPDFFTGCDTDADGMP